MKKVTPLVAAALLVFGCALEDGRTRISQIQGRGHASPFEGREVEGVRGVVTAVDRDQGNPGFWMEDPEGDGDDATSEGLFVSTAAGTVEVEVGRKVEVRGRVEEFIDPERPADLTLTRLRATEVRTLAERASLPGPARLGREGRPVPVDVIDDDSLTTFEPASDAIDFFESLEGMRVEVAGAVVVGATSRFGEIVVVADGAADSGARTRRGGLLLEPEDGNPERLVVSPRLLGTMPQVDVGARLEGPLSGVLDYSFSHFKVLPAALPPITEAEAGAAEATGLRPAEGRLTLATFNVYNLSARDREDKFLRLARTIAHDLGSPDVVAVQEMQDDDGSRDDGVVGAARTFERLLAAVEAIGGPSYGFRQIDPVDGADGGQPGGNIRVGLLFNPRRVDFVDRGEAGPLEATDVRLGAGGPELSLSPGRVSPDDPVFADCRKPLAGEVVFGGEKVFLIAAHLSSKRDDDPLMGRRQPPRRPTEVPRTGQARALRRLMDRLLELDAGARVVVLGDMNEFLGRPPIRALTGSGWVDLIERVPPEGRYTFNFNGNSQVLDHVIVSPALAELAAPEVDVVHVNADAAHQRRSSDHDPVVIRLAIP